MAHVASAISTRRQLRVLWAGDAGASTGWIDAVTGRPLFLGLAQAAGVDVVCCPGLSSSDVLRAADDCNSDLIAISCAGHAHFGAFALDKTAREVVRHSLRPILLSQAVCPPVRRVLISYDGSPAGRRAVRLLESLSLPLDVEYVLADGLPRFAVPARTPIAYRESAFVAAHDINRHRRCHEERRLRAVAALLGKTGRRVVTRVANGALAAALPTLARAEACELVVLVANSQASPGSGDQLAARLLCQHSTSALLVR